jgi:ring-1,2-phenylacetyl-CoA epoxidase subunit PaaE
MNYFTLKVVELKVETNQSMTICFKQPGLKKIKYKAGQFITLSARINGRKYSRAYSFSSSPSSDQLLEVTIKRVPNGIFSNYILDHIKIGDVLEVSEPMGNFVLNTNQTPVTYWGVGSGITPLYSMIKESLNSNRNSPIYLVYGNKKKEETIFLNQLLELQEKHSDIFKIFFFYSEEENFNQNQLEFKGRISNEFINNFIENYSQEIHYICGPSSLKNSLIDLLINFKFDMSMIHFENFELEIDDKEFENISNQNVLLNFKGLENKIEVQRTKSILDAALDVCIELPYSCQTGSCSTCKAILVEGKLKMIGLDKPRTDLSDNEYLLCCSYPLSNDVKITI